MANPWDYVLTLEGACAFAGAVVRRYGLAGRGRPSFPFTVEGSPVGHSSLAPAGLREMRAELWLPEWNRPATWAELSHLLAEGRAQWGRGQAATAVDFARAVVTLGTDRGLTAFHRFAFLERNGRSYLAVDLDTIPVQLHPQADLLKDRALDAWLGALRAAVATGHAPASWQRALMKVEEAILAACQSTGDSLTRRLQALLIALGEAELTVAGNVRAAARLGVGPLPGLHPAWVAAVKDDTAEYHLAAALASLCDPPLRVNLEPVARDEDGWRWERDALSAVWSVEAPLLRNLEAVLYRRTLDVLKAGPDLSHGGTSEEGATPGPHSPEPFASRIASSLKHVAEFLRGAVDDRRLASLILGLSLVDWERVGVETLGPAPAEEPVPVLLPRAYALLKILLWSDGFEDEAGRPLLTTSGRTFVPAPDLSLLSLLRAGRVQAATDTVLRRLSVLSVPLRVRPGAGWVLDPNAVQRLAAALIFPIPSARPLLRLLLRAEVAPSFS